MAVAVSVKDGTGKCNTNNNKKTSNRKNNDDEHDDDDIARAAIPLRSGSSASSKARFSSSSAAALALSDVISTLISSASRTAEHSHAHTRGRMMQTLDIQRFKSSERLRDVDFGCQAIGLVKLLPG